MKNTLPTNNLFDSPVNLDLQELPELSVKDKLELVENSSETRVHETKKSTSRKMFFTAFIGASFTLILIMNIFVTYFTRKFEEDNWETKQLFYHYFNLYGLKQRDWEDKDEINLNVESIVKTRTVFVKNYHQIMLLFFPSKKNVFKNNKELCLVVEREFLYKNIKNEG